MIQLVLFKCFFLCLFNDISDLKGKFADLKDATYKVQMKANKKDFDFVPVKHFLGLDFWLIFITIITGVIILILCVKRIFSPSTWQYCQLPIDIEDISPHILRETSMINFKDSSHAL